MLTVENLSSGYGGGIVLRGVSLSVRPGQVHVVVGPNGAGKTTLVHTVAGLMPVLGGSLVLDGRDITRLSAHRRARLGIRVVPQGGRLFAHLTVREHLDLATRKRADIDLMLESLPSLARRLRHRPDQLSGGEAQMLALARALLGRPKLLLLDEPTDGLSPSVVAVITDLVNQAAGSGVAVLWTVSRESDVDLDDRLTVMQHGRFVDVAATEADPVPDVAEVVEAADIAPSAETPVGATAEHGRWADLLGTESRSSSSTPGAGRAKG